MNMAGDLFVDYERKIVRMTILLSISKRPEQNRTGAESRIRENDRGHGKVYLFRR